MKAYELIKHLEEGGEIDGNNLLAPHDYSMVKQHLDINHILLNLDKYSLVVPKRKTVVEAWVDFGDGPSYLYKALGVVCVTTNSEYADNYEAKVRITLEEL